MVVQRIDVVDSHTGGEPTRVVYRHELPLQGRTLAEQRDELRDRFDWLRRAVVSEPRGSDVLVGCLLGPPLRPEAQASVIFFNNVGYLGMCVHGTIGLVVTLAHLGRLGPGTHHFDTPAGPVATTLHDDWRVTVENVVSYRQQRCVRVDVPRLGRVQGDVAWGGNWFFLVDQHREQLRLANVERLTDVAWSIRQALRDAGICGSEGAEIDHIELFGPPQSPQADSKNFVLCPGKAYDRSPCGTGTSAKLACLVADGKLAPGQLWRQESITGSIFTGSAQPVPGGVRPVISGRAWITAESQLLLDETDPCRFGLTPETPHGRAGDE